MQSATFETRFARRIPDPVFPQAERHVFLCAAENVPHNLPKDSNPRAQDIDRRIYRDIAKHLLNEEGSPNTFHLKNKGITVLADRVVKRGEDSYEVVFTSESQGIVDGAHTYEIVLRNQEQIATKNFDSGCDPSIRQFVKFEILTGLESSFVTEIAGGLNTAVQVQPMSLANLAGRFAWIQEELQDERYFGEIAFKQNEKGHYDAKDILQILELFNVDMYPNSDSGSAYPIRAYSSKEKILESYLKNPQPFHRMRGILKDILILHDTISYEARELYNRGGGKKGGKLAFVDSAAGRRKKFQFHFIGKESDYQLFRGALFPMLGAFRWMVDDDQTSNLLTWRGGFQRVLGLWRSIGQELMEITHETSDELGKKPEAIGKSPNHWKYLYNRVLVREMRSRVA
jgi:hypothetical protein